MELFEVVFRLVDLLLKLSKLIATELGEFPN